jgi:hypothetical protein
VAPAPRGAAPASIVIAARLSGPGSSLLEWNLWSQYNIDKNTAAPDLNQDFPYDKRQQQLVNFNNLTAEQANNAKSNTARHAISG